MQVGLQESYCLETEACPVSLQVPYEYPTPTPTPGILSGASVGHWGPRAAALLFVRVWRPLQSWGLWDVGAMS